MSEDRPPLPPFTRDSAMQKVRAAEDGWNSCDPERVSLAYTVDSAWRNRSEFLDGRAEIVAFLTRKWSRELEYRLIKELWTFAGDRIAVRFAYEYHDDFGKLVSRLRQRELGVRRAWADAAALCLDQRSADPRRRPAVYLGSARSAAEGSSRLERARPVTPIGARFTFSPAHKTRCRSRQRRRRTDASPR